MIRNLSFIILLCLLLFTPLITKAAILYLTPDNGQFHQGDTFMVEIRLDTQGEYINAVEANLSFSSDILEVKDLSQGNSVLTLWVKEPTVSQGVISLAGGTPGGYQGANGILTKIAFKARVQGVGQVNFLNNSKALLNDGKGTEAKLSTKNGSFSVLAKKLEAPEDQWQKELGEDKTAPLPFKIEISRNPAIFEGKYFIIFSTTDKETGVDYYEVKEGKGNWEKAISPYVLKNQNLTSDIWVKAVDKAGNEWVEIVKAAHKPIWEYILYGVLFLILLSGIIILVRKIL